MPYVVSAVVVVPYVVSAVVAVTPLLLIFHIVYQCISGINGRFAKTVD